MPTCSNVPTTTWSSKRSESTNVSASPAAKYQSLLRQPQSIRLTTKIGVELKISMPNRLQSKLNTFYLLFKDAEEPQMILKMSALKSQVAASPVVAIDR